MSDLIVIDHLTKDYGNGRGIFDITLSIKKGECLGLVGSNGAGKTTLIRSLMGFVKPTSGYASIHGFDAWKEPEKSKPFIGYVPGEIAFPDLGTGKAFIRSQAEFLGLTDLSYANELVNTLQIDLSAELKKMSKGMKQKTALVEALMNDAEILIMDEPSTGLDPLMRLSFIDVIQKERKKGKTILMSSHLYGEVEQLCNRVALIHNGRIEEVVEVNSIINTPYTEYKIEFIEKTDYLKFKAMGFSIIRNQENFDLATIRIEKNKAGWLIEKLQHLNVKFIQENTYTLERHFKHILSKYKKELEI